MDDIQSGIDSTSTLSEQAAEELRALLARRRMSGRDLAKLLSVSPSWVSYRLTGTTEIGLNDLQRIATALEVEVSSLLPASRTINSRSGRPAGRPRSTAKLHARNSTISTSPTPAVQPPAPVAAALTSGPRSRPFWREA